MPGKKPRDVKASTEETQPKEEETPEVKETPEVPPEEAPIVEEAEKPPVVVEAPEVEVKAPPVAPPSEVPVSWIPDGALFEYKGQIYSMRMIQRFQRVLADVMVKTGDIYSRTEEEAWLDFDIQVKPKQ